MELHSPDQAPFSGGPVVEPRQPFLVRMQPVTFAVLSLLLVFFLYQFVAGGLTFLLFKGRVTDDNAPLVRWSTLVGQLLCILLPTLLLVRARERNLVTFLRIRLPGAGQLIATFVGVFALQQMLQGYMAVQDAIPLPPVVKELVDKVNELFAETYRILISAQTPSQFILVVVSVALVPAIAEELLFRGLVQRTLERVAGGYTAAIVTGIIFGAYHLNPFSLVPLAALGIYFGFIVVRSQNISLAIAAHFFNNFVACAAVYLQLRDDFVVVAPAGSPTPAMQALNFALFTLVFLGATYYFMQLTRQTETT